LVVRPVIARTQIDFAKRSRRVGTRRDLSDRAAAPGGIKSKRPENPDAAGSPASFIYGR
jgi:hypothetical protein